MGEVPVSTTLVRLQASGRWSQKQTQQQCKIRQIGEALAAAGICTIDEQAQALGIARSTTWTILNAGHKASGLSARIIERILQSPALPPEVRTAILEYVREKAAGAYGHKVGPARRFSARLISVDAQVGILRPASVIPTNGIEGLQAGDRV